MLINLSFFRFLLKNPNGFEKKEGTEKLRSLKYNSKKIFNFKVWFKNRRAKFRKREKPLQSLQNADMRVISAAAAATGNQTLAAIVSNFPYFKLI